jgi:hypothetical protein
MWFDCAGLGVPVSSVSASMIYCGGSSSKGREKYNVACVATPLCVGIKEPLYFPVRKNV